MLKKMIAKFNGIDSKTGYAIRKGDEIIYCTDNVMMMAAAPILLKALQHLQANPNDPRMHRQALDAINLVLR
jgi:hypothetical protein